MIGATYWLSQNCVRHSRISGGVVVLLRRMNVWLREQHQSECELSELIVILSERHLPVREVAGVLLVPGLALKQDVHLLRRFKG
jgi:hypothetical protein